MIFLSYAHEQRSIVEEVDLALTARGHEVFFALTELKFAKEKWRNPAGHVLPVMAVPTLLSRIDSYLRAVTILYPQGHLPAEVASRVDEILHRGEPIDAPPSRELLRERIDSYRELWELTKLLPRWLGPKTSTTTISQV